MAGLRENDDLDKGQDGSPPRFDQHPQNSQNGSTAGPSQQIQDPPDTSNAPGNPGPPPDQVVMAAVMASSSHGNYNAYSNDNRPRMEQGSNNYGVAPYDTYRSNQGHAPAGYRLNTPYGVSSTSYPAYLGNPPLPLGYDPPNQPYGFNPNTVPGPRPTVDAHGNVTSEPPATSGPSTGHAFQPSTGSIPETAPTQERYGIPGLDYLPVGYSWSDYRCNNCHIESKSCSAFPKFNKEVTKDLTKTLFKFPCDRCAADPDRRATCTWNIIKSHSAKEGILYWTGARVIPDSTPRAATTKYAKYKHHRVIDRLETPPWPQRPGPSNQPGSYQTRRQREEIRQNASAVTVHGPRPVDQSGRIGKLNPVVPKVRGKYRPRKNRTCNFCQEDGEEAAKKCNIARRKPCKKCEDDAEIDGRFCQEYHNKDAEKEGSDSGLSVASTERELIESVRSSTSTGQSRRSGRIKNIFASGMSTRSTRSGSSTTPSRNRRGTGKGNPGSGGIQRSPSEYRDPRSGSPQQSLPFASSPMGGQGGDGHNAASRIPTVSPSTQALIDRLASMPDDTIAAQQPGQTEPDSDSTNTGGWMSGTLPDSPEHDGVAQQFQQGSVYDPFFGIRNHDDGASQAQPFQEVRNHNAAQSQYEADIQLDERAANVLVQNHQIVGGSPLQAINLPVQPQAQGIQMHNVDDQTIDQMRDLSLEPLSGPVLPQVGLPPYREFTGSEESCEDTDGCNEADFTKAMEGIFQMCGSHPTKPCSVALHGAYCVCVYCRAAQDQCANTGSSENPGQQSVIDATKYFYCRTCADLSRKEFQDRTHQASFNTCLCTIQMTKAWMCGLHRQQAKMLVHRRTMIMRAFWLRKLGARPFGSTLPCSRCGTNAPDSSSGVWECAACNEKVIT